MQPPIDTLDGARGALALIRDCAAAWRDAATDPQQRDNLSRLIALAEAGLAAKQE